MPYVLCSEQQMNSMKIRLYSTKLSFKFQYTLLKLLTTPHPTVHCNRATRNTSVFTFSTLTANDELHTHTTRQNRDAEVRDTRRRGATDRRLSTTAAATTGDAGWMPHTDVVVFAVLADALQTTLHYTAKRRTHTHSSSTNFSTARRQPHESHPGRANKKNPHQHNTTARFSRETGDDDDQQPKLQTRARECDHHTTNHDRERLSEKKNVSKKTLLR